MYEPRRTLYELVKFVYGSMGPRSAQENKDKGASKSLTAETWRKRMHC
jgi:hypothetical protein